MIISKISLFCRNSVFKKIYLSILILVFLPLVLIVGFTYNKVLELSQTEFKSYSMQTVKQIEQNLSTYMQRMETLAYTISTNNTIQQYLSLPEKGKELDKMLAIQEVRYLENNIRYDDVENTYLIISGLNGELYSSRGYLSNINYDFSFNDNIYTKKINGPRNPTIYLGPHRSEQTLNEKIELTLLRSILKAGDNSLLGYLYLNIDYNIFNKIISNIHFSNDNDVLIMDGDTIIYSRNNNKILKSADAGLYQAVSKDNEGGKLLGIEGRQYFFTYTTMKKPNWKIVLLHSMESYNNKAFSLMQFIIVTSAASFIITVFIAIFISFAITKPIKSLTSIMKSVEKENFNIKFVTRSKDEIATLGNVFNSMIERIRDLILSIYKSKIAEKDAMIYALQSQINPHFLYNTLQSISNIAQLERVPGIADMCRGLSLMFRYNIEAKRRFVMLYDEVMHIKNYFYLQSIQYKERLKYTMDISEDLLNIRVPRFILQPLVENSISHGLNPKPEGGKISLCAQRDDGVLWIAVEDDGVGMNADRLNEILETINRDVSSDESLNLKFLALNNVNKRLVLNYGDEYALKIESAENTGTKVTIKIPLDGYKSEPGTNWN